MDVAYCAQLIAAPHYTQPEAVPLEVGAHVVNLDWILPEIRFKGNAYGAWFRYDALGGSAVVRLLPRPARRAHAGRVRRAARDWVNAGAAGAATEIGARHHRRGQARLRPAAAAPRHRHWRCSATWPASLPRCARRATNGSGPPLPPRCGAPLEQTLAAGFPRGAVCVVSSRDKLEQANGELGADPLAIEEILQHG